MLPSGSAGGVTANTLHISLVQQAVEVDKEGKQLNGGIPTNIMAIIAGLSDGSIAVYDLKSGILLMQFVPLLASEAVNQIHCLDRHGLPNVMYVSLSLSLSLTLTLFLSLS